MEFIIKNTGITGLNLSIVTLGVKWKWMGKMYGMWMFLHPIWANLGMFYDYWNTVRLKGEL